jgi:hypothetical protein
MTAIESIFEIKFAVSALARFSPFRNLVVTGKYLGLINRFFHEDETLVESGRR